jgi:N-acetylmuramoyl-L-alanine amidase
MALKLALDAGHGLSSYKGIPKALDKNQTKEWTLNDRIADKLEVALIGYDVSIIRTDDTTGKKDISLKERYTKANEWGADVFISIHHNGGALLTNSGGTVIYYSSSKEERKEQAQSLYNLIVTETRLIGNRSSKVIKKDFTVIAKTTMPAFLCELGFMDSKKDAPIILTEEYADQVVVGIVNFLIKEFGLVKKQAERAEKYQSKKTVDITLHQLKKGDYGTQVATLQRLLASHGFDVSVDKSFGESTHQAAVKFQETNGLKANGIVGNDTWSALLL